MSTCDNTRITDVLARQEEMMRLNAELQRPYRKERSAKQSARSKTVTAKFKAEKPQAYAKIRARAAIVRAERAKAARDGVAPELLAEADRLCREWLDAPQFLCGYCGKDAPKPERTIDHKIARSRGGKHTPDNLARACKSCNSRKSTWAYFYA